MVDFVKNINSELKPESATYTDRENGKSIHADMINDIIDTL